MQEPDGLVVSDTLATPLLQFLIEHPNPDLPGKHFVQLKETSKFEIQEEHVPPIVVISDTLTIPLLQSNTVHPAPECPGKHIVQLVDGSKLDPSRQMHFPGPDVVLISALP
jgi:hypothetical protein